MKRFVFTLAAALLSGCAAQSSLPPPQANNPANPRAAEAPLLPESQTLDAPQPQATSPSERSSDDMAGIPSMGGIPGMSHDNTSATSHPADASPATQPGKTQAIYTCKMHPQVVSEKPGDCPICGMKLVRKKKAAAGETNK